MLMLQAESGQPICHLLSTLKKSTGKLRTSTATRGQWSVCFQPSSITNPIQFLQLPFKTPTSYPQPPPTGPENICRGHG